MLEEVGADGAARLEALALRDHGEALRAETEMTAHNWDEVTRHYRYFDNGLTASWVSEQYVEVMAAYGIEVPPVPEIVPGTRGGEPGALTAPGRGAELCRPGVPM